MERATITDTVIFASPLSIVGDRENIITHLVAGDVKRRLGWLCFSGPIAVGDWCQSSGMGGTRDARCAVVPTCKHCNVSKRLHTQEQDRYAICRALALEVIFLDGYYTDTITSRFILIDDISSLGSGHVQKSGANPILRSKKSIQRCG
jgi:hypothetical protein